MKNIDTAHAQASIKSSGQMLSAFGALAKQSGQDARIARTLSIAGAYVDMYAGANKAFKQGGVLGFTSGIDNLASMNQGQSPITLNISAPLVDETVIDSILPAIEKAQRMNLA